MIEQKFPFANNQEWPKFKEFDQIQLFHGAVLVYIVRPLIEVDLYYSPTSNPIITVYIIEAYFPGKPFYLNLKKYVKFY